MHVDIVVFGEEDVGEVCAEVGVRVEKLQATPHSSETPA